MNRDRLEVNIINEKATHTATDTAPNVFTCSSPKLKLRYVKETKDPVKDHSSPLTMPAKCFG